MCVFYDTHTILNAFGIISFKLSNPVKLSATYGRGLLAQVIIQVWG